MGNGNGNRTAVVFAGVPAEVGTGPFLPVAIARIADSGSAPLHAPVVTAHSVRMSADNAVVVEFELAQGEVALVAVGAGAEASVKAFAEPP